MQLQPFEMDQLLLSVPRTAKLSLSHASRIPKCRVAASAFFGQALAPSFAAHIETDRLKLTSQTSHNHERLESPSDCPTRPSVMAAIRVAPTKAARAMNLLRAVQYTHPPNCPCHSNPGHHHHFKPAATQARRALATPVDVSRQKEYAFQMAASNIRFGPGCTKEVGMDFENFGSKKVMIVTDTTVAKLDAMRQCKEGLETAGIEYVIYEKVRVEPKDTS